MLAATLSISSVFCAQADETLDVPLGHASIIHLSSSPSQVIIGNPAIADVTVQSSRTLAVFGKYPGGTTLTILDNKGNALMETSVMVTSSAAGGVTVHYGTGKNWVPGGMTVSMACATDRCSGATNIPSDSPYKASTQSTATTTATTVTTK